ncbi:MAG: rRNA maturation RNase YbeY [Pseudomonadota bacterium]
MTRIALVVEDARWEELRLAPLGQSVLDAVVARLKVPDGFEVSLLACDDAQITELNRAFRGKARPTNVLSWPAFDLAPLTPGDAPGAPPAPDDFEDSLGDIALAYETCTREAAEQAKSFEAHITHLILHGALHLLGYDHETEADAALMEDLEREILAQLGVADPYSEERPA